jgi:hypothetical protein
VFEALNVAGAFRRGRRRGVGGPYQAGDKNRPPASLRPLGAVSAEMGKAPDLKGVKLEEIKEKLKRAPGIKRDETLLYFATWWDLFKLDESSPESLSDDYIDRLRKEAEARGETVESITEKGLIGLAKYYGTIRWTQFPEPFFLFGSPKKFR